MSDGLEPAALQAPLQGIRVLDLSSVMMGPYAARILGDMGADVVKVESLSGDSLRGIGPMRNPGMGPMFLNCNRNKRSIALDLKSDGGYQAMLALLRGADALIYNVRPQAMRRLRLDHESCRAHNPALIHVGAFGFGQDGPYAALPAYDDLIQGMVALPSLIALASDGEPRYVPLAMVDRFVGANVANALLGALVHRMRTGQGQAIEMPMFETMVDSLLSDHFGGRLFEPPIGPPGYPRSLAPERHPYKTRDGHVCVMVYLDSHWRRFGEIVGKDLIGTDPRYASITLRTAHAREVHAELEQFLLTRTTAEWLEAFQRADVPAVRLHTLESLLADPHLAATGFFELQQHPSEGAIHGMKPPGHWSATPPTVRRHAPRLGEHTFELLQEAGYSHADAVRLVETGSAFAA